MQLCNTSRYVTRQYLSTCKCSRHTHVGQPGHTNAPRHVQSVTGPECSNYHQGSELCNIANGHPISSAQRVLNNTEVKEHNTICIYTSSQLPLYFGHFVIPLSCHPTTRQLRITMTMANLTKARGGGGHFLACSNVFPTGLTLC